MKIKKKNIKKQPNTFKNIIFLIIFVIIFVIIFAIIFIIKHWNTTKHQEKLKRLKKNLTKPSEALKAIETLKSV